MNSQPNKPRPPRSAPRPATGPTASSAARSLRRAAQTAYSASTHSDSPPPLPPSVSVIAQIPNFAKQRAIASNSAHQAPPADPIPDDPYLALSKAARGVDSLAKSRNASLQSLATATAAQPIVAPSAATSPAPHDQTSAASPTLPVTSVTPATPAPPATPVTRDDQERWVERLPEWQRFAIQAVVMIAAAIMVVVGFAWWRQSNEPINEPISRQALKELEIEEGTPDDLSVVDGQESTEPRGSLARKPPRASDWSNRESSGSRNASDTANAASPAYTRDAVSTPTTIEDPAPGSPAATSPSSPPPTTPPHALDGATPTINAPEQAGYPSTDPRRFQFGGLAPSGAGGNSPPGTTPQQPATAGGSTQPPSETARLGEITPLRSGNLR